MTEDEVYELLVVLGVRYPDMPMGPQDQARWVNGLAADDTDAVRASADAWMSRRAEWPTVAELHGTVHLRTAGLDAARSALRRGYESEVQRHGRLPKAWVIRGEPVEQDLPSKEPGSLGSDTG